jgi:hypothetical protein
MRLAAQSSKNKAGGFIFSVFHEPGRRNNPGIKPELG